MSTGKENGLVPRPAGAPPELVMISTELWNEKNEDFGKTAVYCAGRLGLVLTARSAGGQVAFDNVDGDHVSRHD